ncbi:MAG: hypothetical protein C3F11_03400 [Methylocystaceae bacterium]|nr:MAG: hypothetical protein C3F11_03400 [Methylocystaceae bacterium]
MLSDISVRRSVSVSIGKDPSQCDPFYLELVRLFESDPLASPYCHPLWVSLLGAALGRDVYWCLARAGSRLVAALPHLRRVERFPPVTVVESLPYNCYAAPLMSQELDAAGAVSAARALYQKLSGAAVISRAYPPEWLDERIAFPAAAVVNPRACSEQIYVKRLDLLASEQALRSTYTKHHRKQLAVAERSPLEFYRAKTQEDLSAFYDLLGETMSRAAKPIKFSHEMVVVGGQQLIMSGVGTCYLAKLDGECCAGAFVLSSKAVTMYWLGATTSDKRALAHFPAYFLLHQALRDSLQQGVRMFELGAAPTQGLLDFKSKWGAKPVSQFTYSMGSNWVQSAAGLRSRLMRCRLRSKA